MKAYVDAYETSRRDVSTRLWAIFLFDLLRFPFWGVLKLCGFYLVKMLPAAETPPHQWCPSHGMVRPEKSNRMHRIIYLIHLHSLHLRLYASAGESG